MHVFNYFLCCICRGENNIKQFTLQSLEAEKLAPIAKNKERAQEAISKAQQENEEFSRATQEKLRRSMEVNKENRDAQIQALQTRLRDHVSTLWQGRLLWKFYYGSKSRPRFTESVLVWLHKIMFRR